LRFPGFADEWKRIKVSELLDFYSTNSLSWDMLNYDGGEIKNLHYGLIHSGLPTLVDVSKDSLPFANEASTPKKYTLCKKGDIVFADASEDTNEVAKAIEFINVNDENVICGLHTIHGRDNSDKTIVGFKGYAFSSMQFHHQIRRIAQGTKIYSISTKTFDEVSIGVPSKDEQVKIARLLHLLDERIATQNKIIDNLQSLIKGLAKTHYDSCETLSNVRIRELGEPYSVMNLSKEQLSDNGQPCILYGELFTQYGPVIESIYSKTNVESNLSLSNGRDLLFPSSTTVDALSLIAPSALTKPNIILGGDMFGIKVANEYSPEYLSYYFNYIGNHELAKYAIGSTIIHLHYKDIAEHTIALPTLRNQLSFVKLASTMKSKIENEKSVLHNLKTLKAYLLQAMFI
jgi:type I restriction enzyme S subunit